MKKFDKAGWLAMALFFSLLAIAQLGLRLTHAASTPSFIQVASATPQTNQTTVTAKYAKAQVAGDTNIIAVGWNDITTNVTSVTDTAGNTYVLAAPVVRGNSESQAIYYAKNIVAAAANANTVTAQFSAPARYVDLRITEYGGLDTGNPFDKAAAASGSASSASTPSVTTSSANELIFGAGLTSGHFSSAGSGFTVRIITTPDADIVEDKNVSAIGSYNAVANQSGNWVMQVATFKAAGSAGDTTAPSVPAGLKATASSSSQINLSWTSSTDNVGVAGYKIFRGGTQIGTSTTPTYQDTGLNLNTKYSYTVSAYDAAGNNSAQSTSASATTLADSTPPSVPIGLAGSGTSDTKVSLSWSASTDNVGVTGYKIFRGGTQVGSTTQTTFQDTGLAPSTTYSYTISANDAAGNNSAQSAAANVSTLPDTTPPAVNLTAPTNNSTVEGSVTLAATASDDIGITKVEFSVDGQLVNTDTSTPYNYSLDTTALTNAAHSLSAKAYDAAGNSTSAAINVTVNNPVPDTIPPSAPAGLSTTSISSTSVGLSWTASTDNVGVTGYQIVRNGAQVGTSTTATYTDSALTPSTAYTYSVQAFDAAGNVSAASSPLNATTSAPAAGPAFPLKVSSNGRYMVDQNNQPFLMVGDSPQSLSVDNSITTAESYIDDRASHGFNTLWINLVCADYTFCNSNGMTYDNVAPFTVGSGPSGYTFGSTPCGNCNAAFFSRAHAIVQYAQSKDMEIMLDPAETGSWLTMLDNQGNGSTGSSNPDYQYGVYLGNTFKDLNNITWFSGNDFGNWMNATDDANVQAVANGIKSTDPSALQTIELLNSDVTSLDDTTHNWTNVLSLNGAYTYNSDFTDVQRAYNQNPTMPDYLQETGYEGEDLQWPGTPYNLRNQEWWAMLSGASGQLYGNYYTDAIGCGSACDGHGGGTGNVPGPDAYNAADIDTTGVKELGYQTSLLSSVAWYNLVPQTNGSGQLVTSGGGTCSSGGFGSTCVTAAETPDGSLALVYTPGSDTMTVNLAKMGGAVTARWYDPTDGTYTTINGSPFANSGSQQFTTPGNNSGGNSDWVLVLQGPDTTAPSAPTGLSAMPVAATTVNLSWNASTDNVGVTGYNVFRNGVQVGTAFSNSFTDTGLSASTSYIYTVSAFDQTGNTSGISNSASATTPLPDTTSPSTPVNLQATNVTSQSATITWGASTDDLGVAGYNVYRNGVQIASTAGLSYPDVNLLPNTTYSYTVAAYDYSGNVSPQSQPLIVTTPPNVTNPAFVQLAQTDATASSNSISSGSFSSVTQSGDTIVVWLWYNSNTQHVTSVTDTAGDTYSLAAGPTTGAGVLAGWRQEIWYAKNITGKSGVVVTANFSGTFSGEKSITAHEYSGLDTNNPLDTSASGTSAATNAVSPAITTNASKELIFSAVVFGSTGQPGSGFTGRSTIADNLSEDEVVSNTGTHSASFVNSAQDTLIQIVAFKAAGQ